MKVNDSKGNYGYTFSGTKHETAIKTYNSVSSPKQSYLTASQLTKYSVNERTPPQKISNFSQNNAPA